MDAPPRSFHCHLCNYCILKRDHHCFVTGSCVGYHNQRIFVVFCLYTLISTTWAAYLQFCYLNEVRQEQLSADPMFTDQCTSAGKIPAETEVMVSQLCLMCGSTLNCQTLCLGARPRYNLVVDEDVKKPTNQPTSRQNTIEVKYSSTIMVVGLY